MVPKSTQKPTKTLAQEIAERRKQKHIQPSLNFPAALQARVGQDQLTIQCFSFPICLRNRMKFGKKICGFCENMKNNSRIFVGLKNIKKVFENHIIF